MLAAMGPRQRQSLINCDSHRSPLCNLSSSLVLSAPVGVVASNRPFVFTCVPARYLVTIIVINVLKFVPNEAYKYSRHLRSTWCQCVSAGR